MISNEIKKKIHFLQLKTKKMLSGSLVGDYSTAQKGSGFEFDQIRAYEQGDDVRFIDWKSSARSMNLLVKQYLEERNRTILIAFDISSSTLFSSGNAALKYEWMAQIAAVIALIADYGKDKTSLVFFSDKIEDVIELGCGPVHVQRLMHRLFSCEVMNNKKTDLAVVFDYIAQSSKQRAVLFIVSDFIDLHNYERALRMATQRNEIIAIRCLDSTECAMPNVGILAMEDIETGERITIDTGSKYWQPWHQTRLRAQEQLLKKYNIDLLQISPQQDFFPAVVNFFKQRMMY